VSSQVFVYDYILLARVELHGCTLCIVYRLPIAIIIRALQYQSLLLQCIGDIRVAKCTKECSQASLPQSPFLVCLSSLASVFLRPHFLFVSANFSSFSCAIIGDEQQRLTKKFEHSNFSAKATRVHFFGSSALNRLISSISAWPRWYFFSYGFRTGFSFCIGDFAADGDEVAGVEAGVDVEVGASVCSFLLGSDLGRNF